MPVRELVNRISFDLNRADLANVESAFSKMKLGAKAVIGVIAGITVAGTKLFTDFEKDTGASKFFARNKEEADALLKVLDKMAESSETVSRREARRAAKTLQSTRLTKEQLEEFIPILEKISVARPDLDFTAVAENFRDVISGGDVQKLIEIIPGFKDTAELLSKTTFGKPFGDITDIQRGEIVLDALLKSRKRLDELVQEQRKTLVFQFESVQESLSDAALDIGEKIAPSMIELLKELNKTIDALNESKGLWIVVGATIEAIADVIKFTRETTGIFSDVFSGDTSSFKKKQKEFEERKRKELPEGSIFLPGELEKRIKKMEFGIPSAGPDLPSILGLLGLSPEKTKETEEKKITIGGKLTVVNESGVEISQMSIDLTSQIMGELKDSLKNITASNGGIVGV